MQINENLIRSVVEQVLSEVRSKQPSTGTSAASSTASSSAPSSAMGRFGLFDNVDDAVRAARTAFEQLRERSIADRRRIIDHIRRISIDNCVELGTMEMNETKVGRLQHKIEKLKMILN